jgi:hypothetical protein
MKHLNFKLRIAATVAQSLFAVACLVILIDFVPMWQNLSPSTFLQWFADHGKDVGKVMLPLEIMPLMLSLNCYIRSAKQHDPIMKKLFSTCICNFVILAMFFLYFLPLNSSFMNQSLHIAEVRQALADWQFFHVIRTIIAFIAAMFSLLSVMPVRQSIVIRQKTAYY